MSLIHKAALVAGVVTRRSRCSDFRYCEGPSQPMRMYCFYCGSTDPFDHICDPDPKKFVRGHTRWLQPPIFAEIRYCQACGCQLDMCSDECLNCGNIE